ncbi:hypothetical protein MalM25_08650 [Planctomycetes bacterium MalM25]|nr:hypothetical protein MalM25_08650 [Planctomycetes bacterium MalM25]
MQIELPDKAIELANRLADDKQDAATVITEALAKMAWERQEVAAIQEGIDAYQTGQHRPVDEFLNEFMAEVGLTPPE